MVNVKKAYELSYINNQNDLYCYFYKQMTERFQYYFHDLTRTVGTKINGIIICDHQQPNDDQQCKNTKDEVVKVLHLTKSVLAELNQHRSIGNELIFCSPKPIHTL